MLKKLAKYGNSTTLVIDKAILELLNMDESSLVKLQTDGKSLIITPVSRTDKEKISYGADEALQIAIKTVAEKQLENSKVNQTKVEELMPTMQQDFQQAFEKHKTAMKKITENLASNQEFQEALAILAQKYDPVTQSQDYVKELHKLKAQLFPEFAELDKDIASIAQKYNNI